MAQVTAGVGEDVRPALAAAAARNRDWLLAGCGALFAALFMWFITAPHGAGATSDSIAYVATARSINAGHSWGYWLQPHLTIWPLGYPVVLAAVSHVTGNNVFQAGRLVEIGVAAAGVLSVYWLASLVLTRRWLRLAVTAAASFASGVIVLQDKLLTDAAFSVGTVALVAMLICAARGSRGWLFAAVGTTSALFLTRYAGAGFVGVGAVVLAASSSSAARKPSVSRAATYAFGSAFVPLVYFARNYAVSGDFFGATHGLADQSSGALSAVPKTFALWTFTRSLGSALGVLVGLAVLTALVVLAAKLIGRQGSGGDAEDGVEPARMLAIFWLLSLLYLVGLRLVSHFDLDGRTMGFLLPLSLLLGAAALERLDAELAIRVCIAWAVVVVLVGLNDGLDFRSTGSGYTGRVYASTIAELHHAHVAQLTSGCEVRSNQPGVLYLGGVKSRPIGAGAGRRACVVWFKPGKPAGEPTVAYSGRHFTVYRDSTAVAAAAPQQAAAAPLLNGGTRPSPARGASSHLMVALGFAFALSLLIALALFVPRLS